MEHLKSQKQNPSDQDTQWEQEEPHPQSSTDHLTKLNPKPMMSKREIMEELSRQRFPWEE